MNLLKKCKNFYYRHMLDLNQLYSRYLNHMIILVLLIVVHFFSLSYLVVQTAELLPLDQYRISLKNDNASELELFTFPTTRREPVCQKLKQYNQKSSYHKMGKLQNNLYITDQYLNGQKCEQLFSMSSKIFLIIASILSGFFIMS